MRAAQKEPERLKLDRLLSYLQIFPSFYFHSAPISENHAVEEAAVAVKEEAAEEEEEVLEEEGEVEEEGEEAEVEGGEEEEVEVVDVLDSATKVRDVPCGVLNLK